MKKEAVVVYISGFMTPTNIVCYPDDMVPANVKIITVFPSPVGSIHDRVCQIFYELKGGTVDYGEEHSRFHGHQQFGKSFVGKYPVWDKSHPIIIVGHSLGGVTAWALHNYLAKGRFKGFSTSAAWVSGIVAVNAPLNGALQVYNKGMDIHLPALLNWLSPGHCVGIFAQTLDFLCSKTMQRYFDPELGHWDLSYKSPGSIYKWLLCFFGYGVYSTSDHIAFDTALHSQLEWHKYNTFYADTYYCSIVGNLQALPSLQINPKSMLEWIVACIYEITKPKPPSNVAGMDTSFWSQKGHDGLLSVHTQEFPRLVQSPDTVHGLSRNYFHHPDLKLSKGVWYHYQVVSNHLTAALQGRHLWQEIFSTVLKIHEHHLEDERIQYLSISNLVKKKSLPVHYQNDSDDDVTTLSETISVSSFPSIDSISSLRMQKTREVFPREMTFSTVRTPDMQEIELILSRCHIPAMEGIWSLISPFGNTNVPIISLHIVESLCCLFQIAILSLYYSRDFPVSEIIMDVQLMINGMECFTLGILGPQWSKYCKPSPKLILVLLLKYIWSFDQIRNSIFYETVMVNLTFSLGAISFLPAVAWIWTNQNEDQSSICSDMSQNDHISLKYPTLSSRLHSLETVAIFGGCIQWILKINIFRQWWLLSISLIYGGYLHCIYGVLISICMVLSLLSIVGTKGNELFRATQYNLIRMNNKKQAMRIFNKKE